MMDEYILIAADFAESAGLSLCSLGLIAFVVVFMLLFLLRRVAFFGFLFRWLQRLIVLAALCGLGVWLFYIGREHQIFLDNKTLGEHKALEQVNVSVNGGEVVELMERERDVKKVTEPSVEVRADVFDEDGNVVKTLTKRIELGFSRDIMINLPAFAGGSGDYILPAPR